MRLWPQLTPQPLSGDALRGTCILLITRSPGTQLLMDYVAETRTCAVRTVQNVLDARWEVADCVVLDLPAWETHDALRRFAGVDAAPAMPVAVMGPDDPVSAVLCLQLGADLYLPTTSTGPQIAARLNALVRRNRASLVGAEVLRAGPLLVDLGRCEASIDGRPIEQLTATELRLLAVLTRAGGRMVSRTELRDRVWGRHYPDLDPRSIDAHIYRLRRKIGVPQSIVPVPRFGYRIGL